MRDFEFLEPDSLPEACSMLKACGEGGRLFAGGTALMLAMRQRMVSPTHLIHIGRLPDLNRIEFDERYGLRIGAAVCHQQIADSDVVKTRYPLLASVAAGLANPQVRNQGTIGGNLAYGDPATDPPGCLIALGARVVLASGDAEREVQLEAFFTDYYETALLPGEVLKEVRIPVLPAGLRTAYTRHLRTPAEHRPLVNVAVAARDDAGVYRDVRIAIGASVPVPTRARRAEQILEGKRISPKLLADAAEAAAADMEPISDFRGSADYRRQVLKVIVRRTAQEALA